MRRRVGGAGCGARACASQAQVPGGLGSPSAPTTGGRPSMGWTGQDERGESPAIGRAKSPPSKSRKHGPGAQNRRGGAPEGDAPCAKGARAARRRYSRQRLSALRPLTFGGDGRKARPAP